LPGVLMVSLAASLVGAGCGSSGTANVVARPTATASPTPSVSATSGQTISVGGSVAPFTLSTIASGVGASGQFPVTTSGSSTVVVTLTSSQPGSTTTLKSMRNRRLDDIGTTNINPIAFIIFDPTSLFDISSFPQLTFTLPPGIAAPNGYWLAVEEVGSSDPTIGWTVLAGPVQASGGTVNFPGAVKVFTFTGSTPWIIALFAPGGTYPAPTPTPVPTPTPAPNADSRADAYSRPKSHALDHRIHGPDRSAGPTLITKGPDGALWFIEGGTIGRVTTSGAFIPNSRLRRASAPKDITTGPDGALWFTDNSGNRIERLTTSGVFGGVRDHDSAQLSVRHHHGSGRGPLVHRIRSRQDRSGEHLRCG